MEIWSQTYLKPYKYYFEINFLLFFIVVTFSDKQVLQWQGVGWMNRNKHEYAKNSQVFLERLVFYLGCILL